MKAPKISVNGRFYKVSSIKYFNNYISFVSYFKDGWLTAAYYSRPFDAWFDEDNNKIKVKLIY